MCLCVSKAKFKLLLKGYFFKLISSNNRTPESWEGREKLANRFPVEPPPHSSLLTLLSPSPFFPPSDTTLSNTVQQLWSRDGIVPLQGGQGEFWFRSQGYALWDHATAMTVKRDGTSQCVRDRVTEKEDVNHTTASKNGHDAHC